MAKVKRRTLRQRQKIPESGAWRLYRSAEKKGRRAVRRVVLRRAKGTNGT